MRRKMSLWLQGLFYLIAGINHFVQPQIYLKMMPTWLPYPEFLQLLSGAFEILCAIALLIPRTQVMAAWGIIGLLIAVFPANLHVALENGAPMSIPAWLAWGRLPFQLLFLYWAWIFTRPKK